MDTLYSPELVFDIPLQAEPGAAGHPVVLVVPSTHATLRLARNLWDHWMVVGTRNGMKTVGSVLSTISDPVERRQTMVFTDQLVRPGDANVLALLSNMQLYLSPLEFILCNKYGYQLGVWTAGGMQWLEPGADLKAVAALITTHLQDCVRLGKDWVEHDKQELRLHSAREKSLKRQLRYLHSSTANTYMDNPAHPVARQLLERISALGESMGRETFA